MKEGKEVKVTRMIFGGKRKEKKSPSKLMEAVKLD